MFVVNLKKLACSPNVEKDDMKRTLEQAIKSNGLDTEIRNIVYHLLRNSNKIDTKPAQCVSFFMESDFVVKRV